MPFYDKFASGFQDIWQWLSSPARVSGVGGFTTGFEPPSAFPEPLKPPPPQPIQEEQPRQPLSFGDIAKGTLLDFKYFRGRPAFEEPTGVDTPLAKQQMAEMERAEEERRGRILPDIARNIGRGFTTLAATLSYSLLNTN